ncbi:aryl-sulfate sulfotransferase [Actinophytocola sp. S1-96]|uniref:Aryl-sulfate sulfotransferase n=2 Tax=Actinophytocola gossypii TaxID=2812003 RepID=A0ABT2J602_9PSEU|nr:aryl-sulfate sulfotransferase [Actinophytocola gossypii]
MDRRALLRNMGRFAVVAGVGAAGTTAGTTVGRGSAEGLRQRHERSATIVGTPQMTVLTDLPSAAPGNIYYTSQGLIVADRHGTTTQHRPATYMNADFRMQNYQGNKVLTWWEVVPDQRIGGRANVSDMSFDIKHSVDEVSPGWRPDLHEFLISPWNTGLHCVYQPIPYDLRPVGGEQDGVLYDSLVVEVDLASQQVLRSWRASDHIPITDSYWSPEPNELNDFGFDYFHINSIFPVDRDHMLISARHTCAVYKINLRTGRVVWQMGGKRSDFGIDRDVSFTWQHDAQMVSPHTMRLFDNASNGETVDRPSSRVIWLHVDERKGRVSLKREVVHPEGISSFAAGNCHGLPNGNTFVGWGIEPRMSEFDPAGNLVFDAKLPAFSYRSYRIAG